MNFDTAYNVKQKRRKGEKLEISSKKVSPLMFDN